MDLLCRSSGQKISKKKSQVFFSNNVGWHAKQQLSEALGIRWTEDMGKNLGVPILHKKLNKETYMFILEKVNQRLSSWKARSLSLASRVTLTKSVLQALPTYVMQIVKLPKSLCKEVDKVCRSFIWDSDQRKLTHLIVWDNVCKPKQFGGLGLRRTRDSNLAFMMRDSWRFCTSNDALWPSVIRSKYKCGSNNIPRVNKKLLESNFWHGICNAWDLFEKNFV